MAWRPRQMAALGRGWLGGRWKALAGMPCLGAPLGAACGAVLGLACVGAGFGVACRWRNLRAGCSPRRATMPPDSHQR